MKKLFLEILAEIHLLFFFSPFIKYFVFIPCAGQSLIAFFMYGAKYHQQPKTTKNHQDPLYSMCKANYEAIFHVQIKFAPHKEKSSTDFAPHME